MIDQGQSWRPLARRPTLVSGPLDERENGKPKRNRSHDGTSDSAHLDEGHAGVVSPAPDPLLDSDVSVIDLPKVGS